jgi:hypothetical protein
MPSISAIQRANLWLLATLCLVLLPWSAQVAFGCMAGGALVAANLVVLAWFTQLVFGAAIRGGRPSPWLALAPLKLLLVVVVAYIAVWRLKLNPGGFALGISTPFFATLIVATRAAVRRSRLAVGSRA